MFPIFPTIRCPHSRRQERSRTVHQGVRRGVLQFLREGAREDQHVLRREASGGHAKVCEPQGRARLHQGEVHAAAEPECEESGRLATLAESGEER